MRIMTVALSAFALAAALSLTPSTHATQAGAQAKVRCHGRVATIVGTTGDDELTGTPGRDVIAGRGGSDHLRGLGGNDVMCAGDGEGSSVLSGGPGDDHLYGGFSWGDVLRGGRGEDLLVGRRLDGQNELLGGPGRDLLRAGYADHLSGNAGADTLLGGPGADELLGGHGNDVIRGRGAPDDIFGDPGHDRLYGGSGRGDILNYTRRWHGLVAGPPHRIPIAIHLKSGTTSAQRWFGHDRETGFESIWTGDGDDRIAGDASDTSFYTGTGTDVVHGGAGQDTVRFDLVRGDSIGAWVPNTYPVRVDVDLVKHRAVLWGVRIVRGRDRIFGVENIVGTRFDDTILGDGHANVLKAATSGYAHEGDDVVRGRGGNDELWGMAGDDTLNGGAGTNTIDGGPGTDTCTNPATGPRTTGCE